MGGNENVEEIKLKPCPFCGGEAEWYRTKRDKRKVFGIYHMIATIKCKRCTAEVSQAGYDADKAFENAAKMWNKRVGQIDEIREIKRKRPKGFDKLTEEYRLK